MLTLLLAATLNIGIYYTFPTEHEAFIIHDRNGGVEIEKQVVKIDIRAKVEKLFRAAEKEINDQIFGGRQTIRLNPVFIEYWHDDHWPMYSDERIPNAVNVDKVWPMLKEKKPQDADIYVVMFEKEMAYFEKSENKMKLAGWLFYKENKIAASGFLQSEEPHQSLLHELGHWLGLKHENCSNFTVMCAFRFPGFLDFSYAYKKAWLEFYERSSK